MSEHALLSPSSAHRWEHCTLAPRLEAKLPAKVSDYAKEGTIAHKVCELTAKKHFKKIKAAEFTKAIKKMKNDLLWDDEMIKTAETYVEHLAERAMEFEHEPYIAFEARVNLKDYVPEAFGTCDCVMFGGDTLIITDYKHGVGVPVSPVKNPQLLLYALGALKLYRPLFGEAIKTIKTYIDQPRRESYEGWSCSIDELLEWGEYIKGKAQQAYIGVGEYKAGEWCQFCRANGICKAQAEQSIGAFDDFASAVQQPAGILTPEQISDVLNRGKTLVDWFKSVQDVALQKLLEGVTIPGYKLVEGRSNRSWTDQDKALETIEKSGINRALIYDSVPKSLSQLEKLLGKPKFKELVGQYIYKPQGSPTLALVGDKRKDYNSAASDFAAVTTENKED